MDADEASDSMRFWTGRHVLGDLSVCYRSAWESVHPDQRLMTFTPENPNSVNVRRQLRISSDGPPAPATRPNRSPKTAPS
jgi:hypothetical protein